MMPMERHRRKMVLRALSGTTSRASRGPGVALIQALRRIGWEAVGPDKWADTMGNQGRAEDDALNLDALMEAIAGTIDKVLTARIATRWQDEWGTGRHRPLPGLAVAQEVEEDRPPRGSTLRW